MDVFKNIEERGVIKGLQKGLQKGLRKGRQEGRQEVQKELILNMLKKNMDIRLMSEVTGLSAEEIKKLKNSIAK